MDCPYILVTIYGKHPHPIPLPQKMPPAIHNEIFWLLESVGEDLPDLTPRRFLRHPILKAYLQRQFPNAQHPPTLSDLHVSLANQAHLGAYIEKAKETHFPAGTGWEGSSLISTMCIRLDNAYVALGLESLKKVQDEMLSAEMHYIRRMIYMTDVAAHEEDDLVTDGNSSDVQIVICMTCEGSQCLLNAQYVQSDMAFKRIVGYYEFELASFDCINNASMSVFFLFSKHLMVLSSRHNILSCIRHKADCCSPPPDILRN